MFDPLTDGQLIVVSGLVRLLRPKSITVSLGDSQRPVEVSPAQALTRPKLIASGVATVAAELAVDFLTQFASLHIDTLELCALDARNAPALLPLPCIARVGLTGDVEGELAFAGDPKVCAGIARQLLKDDGEPLSPPLVRDAIGEFLSTLGGRISDRLERMGYVLEVTPPLEGEPQALPSHCIESRHASTFVSRLGRGQLQVTLRSYSLGPPGLRRRRHR
jgi:hypothetical protein